MESNNHPTRIHSLCVKAIEELQKKADEELGKYEQNTYGRRMSKPVSFVFASKILAIKYFQKNFGKLSAKDIAQLEGKTR